MNVKAYNLPCLRFWWAYIGVPFLFLYIIFPYILFLYTTSNEKREFKFKYLSQMRYAFIEGDLVIH